MSGKMPKRKYVSLADYRVNGSSGKRVYPAAKAFTEKQIAVPQKKRNFLRAKKG